MPDIALSYQRAPRYYAELGALNDFEFGSAGDLVTAANLNASEQGTAWTWTVSRTPLGHTRVEAGNTNFTLPTTVGGVFVGTEGTRRIKFDLDEAVADNLSPVYDVLTATPPSGDFRRVVVTGFITYNATASGFVGIDAVAVGGTPYVVLQLNINGSGSEGSGGEVHIETQVNSGSTYKSASIPITLGTTYHYELFFDNLSGQMALVLRSADLGTLIGTSGKISNDASDINLDHVALQSYLTPEAGAISLDKCGRAWGLATPFPLFPLTVPAPQVVTLSQEDADEIILEWDSLGLAFTIERSADAGASWTTLYADEESVTFPRPSFPHFRYADGTVSDAETYRYRITAHVGRVASAATTSGSLTVDNAPFSGGAWQDAIALGSTDTTEQLSHDFTIMETLTLTGAGSCSRVRIYNLNSSPTGSIKMGLYTNATPKVLLGSGTNTVGNGPEYTEVVLDTPVAGLTNGQVVWVSFHPEIGNACEARYLDGGAANMAYKSEAYADVPTSTFTPDGTLTRTYAVGAYIYTP